MTTTAEPIPFKLAALLALTALVLVFVSIDGLRSSSIDLAHHYALVSRLTEHAVLQAGDASLGEMNYYPRTAHLLGAFAARIAGSPMLGMHAVALLSLALLWASAASMLASLPAWQGPAALALAITLLVLNSAVPAVDLHGAELVGNYFYAQLVAQALVLALLALWAKVEGKFNWAMRYGAMLPAIYLVAGVHLLPALELLGVMVVLIGLEVVQHVRRHQHRLPRALAVGIALSSGGTLLLLFHPSFAAMREISSNNGTLGLRHLGSVSAVLVFSALMTASSGTILWQWLRDSATEGAPSTTAAKYIGAYGLSVSMLCLLQGMALSLGDGSEYAVKKYAFALNSVALLQLSLVPALLARRNPAGPAWLADSTRRRRLAVLLPPLMLAAAFGPVMRSSDAQDTFKLVALEHHLQTLSGSMPPSSATHANYVAAIDQTSPLVAYMMSIGLFHAPRSQAADDIVRARPITAWHEMQTIVTSAGSALDVSPNCRRAPADHGLVMVDAACLAHRLGYVPSRIGFGKHEIARDSCTLKGFSVAEDAGTWTDQTEASIVCPLMLINGKTPTRVDISGFAFVTKDTRQRIRFSTGGDALERAFSAASSQQPLSLALNGDGKQVEIRIAAPDAVSPTQVGAGNDGRSLGFFVQAIEFHSAQ